MACAYEPLKVESSLSRFYLLRFVTDYVFLFGEKNHANKFFRRACIFLVFWWEKERIANKYHIKAMYTWKYRLLGGAVQTFNMFCECLNDIAKWINIFLHSKALTQKILEEVWINWQYSFFLMLPDSSFTKENIVQECLSLEKDSNEGF